MLGYWKPRAVVPFLAVAGILFFLVECRILAGMVPCREKNIPYLVVLGAQVKGTRLSGSLYRRIEKAETARCLGCGATKVDQYLCIGCGQCTTKCKFDAISLERRYDVQFGAFEQMPIQVAKYAVKRTGKILASAAKK